MNKHLPSMVYMIPLLELTDTIEMIIYKFLILLFTDSTIYLTVITVWKQ